MHTHMHARACTHAQKTHTVTLKSRTTTHSTQISCCYMVSTQNQQSDQNTRQLTCLTVTLSSRCSPAQTAQATPRNSFTVYVHTTHNHSHALTDYPTTSRFCSMECRHTANAQLSQTGGEPYISNKYTILANSTNHLAYMCMCPSCTKRLML